jgi:predicted acylesterase/phospholipase RssA
MAKRIGLALSGGGSKGAFTVGALKVVRQKLRVTSFPVISGTSTGALIGTLLATNQWTRLVSIYSNVVTEDIVNPNHAFIGTLFGPEAVLFASAIIGGRAVYDTSALRATIRANADFQRVKESETLLIYNTVDLQTGEIVTFNNREHTATTLSEALLASANMPVLTEPVPIKTSSGTHQYVDGGVREFLPLAAVFDSGVELDQIIAISTAPLAPTRHRGNLDNIMDILKRTVDLLNTEVGHNDFAGAQLFNAVLQMLATAEALGVPREDLLAEVDPDVKSRLKGKRVVPITFIGPAEHLDMEPLTFEPEVMRDAMRLGFERAKEVLS